MSKKLMSPEAEEAPAAAARTKKTSGLPKKDTDLMNTAQSVAKRWLSEPVIILLWCKASEFDEMVKSYSADLRERLDSGSKRPSQTRKLQQLDKQAENAVKDVKVYIQKKFKKAYADAEYPRYGISKEAKTWQLPRDRDKRIEALRMMIAAIEQDGFINEEFGKAFWTELYDDFIAAAKIANLTDGTVSSRVAGKNDKREKINGVMIALRFVLRGNYPETYKSVYRNWGWQKEDY